MSPISRCGCASDQCSCIVAAGDGIVITGTGSPRNPYVVTSTVTDIKTGFKVQYNNVDVIRDIHALDFRGTAVHIDPGTDEAVVTVTVPDPTTGAILPPGMIAPFGMATPPSGWLACDGRTDLLIATYPNLYAAIGTTFGGNGTTTFGVPNLVGKFPFGASGGLGVVGGSSTKGISTANLPPHTHAINHDHPAVNTSSGGSHEHNLEKTRNPGSSGLTLAEGTTTAQDVGGGGIQADGSHVHSVNVPTFTGSSSSVGSGTPMDVMPPYQAVAYMIKT